jgi:hypothetical protein
MPKSFLEQEPGIVSVETLKRIVDDVSRGAYENVVKHFGSERLSFDPDFSRRVGVEDLLNFKHESVSEKNSSRTTTKLKVKAE